MGKKFLWRIRHKQVTLTSEIVGSILATDPWHLYEELVNAVPKAVGFFPGTPVSSHKECWQGGLGLAPDPATIAVLQSQRVQQSKHASFGHVSRSRGVTTIACWMFSHRDYK
jgi:hypothetical protein